MADAISGVKSYRDTGPSQAVGSEAAAGPAPTSPEPVSRAAVGAASPPIEPASATQTGSSPSFTTPTSRAVEPSQSTSTSQSPVATPADTPAPRATAGAVASDNFTAGRGGVASAGVGITGPAAPGGSLAAAGDRGSVLDASAAAEVATLTAGARDTGPSTVRVESLGSPSAMTKELLQALSANQPGATASDQAAIQTTLLALTQKAVDNIPRLMFDTDAARSANLYREASQAARMVDQNLLASQSTRVQPSAGPQWPLMLLDGLRAALADGEQGRGPHEALLRANFALFGRECSLVTHQSPPSEVFRLASLANSPLGLPVAGLLELPGAGSQGVVIINTQLAANGEQMLTLLDVAASLEQGREVQRSVELNKFVTGLQALVVPNGRPVLAAERRQEDALHTLGLIGCCLTSGGGAARASGQGIAVRAPRGGRGLLENRCLTCAHAQKLCQPERPAPRVP